MESLRLEEKGEQGLKTRPNRAWNREDRRFIRGMEREMLVAEGVATLGEGKIATLLLLMG